MQTAYTARAFNATLFEAHRGICGVALRTKEGKVFFLDDATQTWRELTDADAPNMHLHGRVDLVTAAAITDGNLVITCSRTLQKVAA